jgi:hypothetical protein
MGNILWDQGMKWGGNMKEVDTDKWYPNVKNFNDSETAIKSMPESEEQKQRRIKEGTLQKRIGDMDLRK